MRSPDSQNGKVQKIKFGKVADFQRPKTPHKTPQITTHSPQIHHVFTTTNHPKIAKSPAKSPFSPSSFFSHKKNANPKNTPSLSPLCSR
jgi:hypothetical protein